MTLRCRRVTSASSQRAETLLTDKQELEVIPVIQFDYADAGTLSRSATFSTSWLGLTRAQAQLGHQLFLINGKEDPYIVSSILSLLSELGHSKVVIKSGGEPAS